MSKHICEASLRHILNLRAYKKQLCSTPISVNGKYRLSTHEIYDLPSTKWATTQSKLINSIGLEEWLKTKHALGYKAYIDDVFETYVEKR